METEDMEKERQEKQEKEQKAIEELSTKYGLDVRQFFSKAEYWPYPLLWDIAKINSFLKKCPFCGEQAEIIDFQYDDGMSYAIQCTKCEAMSGEYDERLEAVSKWNQRVS